MDARAARGLGTGWPRPESIGQCAAPLPFTEKDLQPVLRNVRIDGQRTSIRLEAAFWAALDRQLTTEGRGLTSSLPTSARDFTPTTFQVCRWPQRCGSWSLS